MKTKLDKFAKARAKQQKDALTDAAHRIAVKAVFILSSRGWHEREIGNALAGMVHAAANTIVKDLATNGEIDPVTMFWTVESIAAVIDESQYATHLADALRDIRTSA